MWHVRVTYSVEQWECYLSHFVFVCFDCHRTRFSTVVNCVLVGGVTSGLLKPLSLSVSDNWQEQQHTPKIQNLTSENSAAESRKNFRWNGLWREDFRMTQWVGYFKTWSPQNLCLRLVGFFQCWKVGCIPVYRTDVTAFKHWLPISSACAPEMGVRVNLAI